MSSVTLVDLEANIRGLLATVPERTLLGLSDASLAVPPSLKHIPHCVTVAVAMDASLMDSIRTGPHEAYYAEYGRVNDVLDSLGEQIADLIAGYGHKAMAVASSKRTDEEAIAGDFPHKTGAVLAGLGWIGKNCQVVTPELGPRLRLTSVLTDMPVGREPLAVLQPRCGHCTRCRDACPAGVLSGTLWQPGTPREMLLDARGCDDFKKANYPHFDGMVCGICAAVCPWGLRAGKAA